MTTANALKSDIATCTITGDTLAEPLVIRMHRLHILIGQISAIRTIMAIFRDQRNVMLPRYSFSSSVASGVTQLQYDLAVDGTSSKRPEFLNSLRFATSDIAEDSHFSEMSEIVNDLRMMVYEGQNLRNLWYLAYTMSPYLVDHFSPHEVTIVGKVGTELRARNLADVTALGKFGSAFTLGEIWSSMGDEWLLTDGAT